MDEYKKAVVEFADSKKDFQFTNKGEKHASIVVANLIKTTDKVLRIYSGEMSRNVANDSYLIKMLNIFLESGKELYLILDTMPNEEEISESLKQIISSENNPLRKVKIKIDENNKFKEHVSKVFTDELSHHFMLSDDLSYRIEIDAEEYKAICNFNDKETVKVLQNIFDTFFFEE